MIISNELSENNGEWLAKYIITMLAVIENIVIKIRIRDNFTCQLCGNKKENNRGRNLTIHHIDYDKQNCNKNNLISLCMSCHGKTNGNRDYWYAYFTYIITGKGEEILQNVK